MVGDLGGADMLAGAAAGCRTVLVMTVWGPGSIGEHRSTWAQVEADYVASNLLDAAHFIMNQTG